jgi:hypothetical protein
MRMESVMLDIIVDLVPGGFEPLRRRIASMTIANITDLADRSDYAVKAVEGANPLTGQPTSSRNAIINDHSRSQSVWTLVAKAAVAVSERGRP